MTNRREFLRHSVILGGTLASSGLLRVPAAQLERLTSPETAPLNVLVLGGTGFIGPHLVRQLVARGHRVSIFTRGRREGELPSSVERLIGDRDAKDGSGALAGDYGALAGRRWDFVFDDSANNPAWVQQSTELLRSATTRYLFVSSTGVFYPYRTTDVDESTPVRMSMTEEAADSFGVNKSIAEARTREVFGERAIVIRPTYIVGPGDGSDRFTYWPVRLARGGEVLAPGKTTDRSQFIDVRDLAEFMVHVAETGVTGTFNVAGPRETLTFPHFLEAARAAVGPNASLTWVDDYDFLAEQKLTFACPWGLPRGDVLGMMAISPAKAIAAGLRFRPIELTVRDTLAWWNTLPAERQSRNRFVLTPEREAEILAAWKARPSLR